MNRLLTFEGGQPFTTQDIAFLQDNFNSAMYSLVSSLSFGQDCIITGIREEGYKTNAYPGAVYIKGNIYVLPNETPKVSGTSYYLCIRQEEQEKRLFRDASEHNVYLIDNAYMSESPSEISVDMRSVNTIPEILLSGKGLFEDLGATFPSGTTGTILEKVNFDTPIDFGMIVSIDKSNETTDNTLWDTPMRDPISYSAIVVYQTKAYIIIGSRGGGSAYNLDGTPYNGPIVFDNVKLR